MRIKGDKERLKKVEKYTVESPITILSHLFLDGDIVYIQSYDPVNGRPQKVWTSDREYLGWITSNMFWDINKSITKEEL